MIEVDGELSERFPGIHLAERVIEVEVKPSSNLERYVEEVRSQIGYTLENLKDHPVARAFRDFYWRIGVDPTKRRPSGEALARRILSGGALPKINNLVDAGNLASARTLIPIGIYDLGRISGRLVLRFAEDGEVFEDFRGDRKTLTRRDIVLSDEQGPIHIFPYRDSKRTMITAETRKALIVGCGVPGVPREKTEEACDLVIHYLKLL